MTGLGLAATAAAYLNYQNAKRNYEQIEERSAGVNAVVNRYQQILDEWDYQKSKERESKIDTVENDRPAGLLIGTMLRVGNLVGRIMRAEPTIVISNTSNKRYWLFRVDIQQYLWEYSITLFNAKLFGEAEETEKYAYINRYIKPGETIEIPLKKALGTIANEDGDVELGKLRDAICEKAGKKLITSCPKINLDGIEKADVVLYWSDEKPDLGGQTIMLAQIARDGIMEYVKKHPDIKRAYWFDLPGTLRYCGEAYL